MFALSGRQGSGRHLHVPPESGRVAAMSLHAATILHVRTLNVPGAMGPATNNRANNHAVHRRARA
jgi:hypothetical protein